MAVRGMERDVFLRKRIRTAFFIILACYLGLVGRLVYLQGIRGQYLRNEAIHKRQQTIHLHAQRGRLLDRNESPLAASLYSGVAGFDPSAVFTSNDDPLVRTRTETKLNKSITAIAAALHIPEARVSAIVQNARVSYPQTKRKFYPIKDDLTLDEATAVRKASPRLGFGVQDNTQRVYACNASASQVIGFLGPDGQGAAGLELGCQRWLSGTNGSATAELDARKRVIPGTLQRIQPVCEGLDVHTALDPSAQNIATEEALKVYRKFHPKGVSVVIVEPDTGDILALVSIPNFDANPTPNHPGKRPPISLEALRERCVSGIYEPGSTLKAITIASALERGVITPSDAFYCSGELQVGRRTLHCAHGEVHHTVTPADILRVSCNVAAAKVGLQMGGKQLQEAEKRFGLFDPLDLKIPGEQAGHWSQDSRETNAFSPIKTANVAFGQSITTTPLHVAMAYAAIANGGKLMKPRLLTAVTDAQGKTIEEWKPRVVGNPISAHTSALVTGMLRTVVSNGTGKGTVIPGYTIAGKTGTASKHRKGAYVGSFIGFLPASPQAKPRAVILVAVDEPDSSKAYYGADVAAPAFHEIASRLMSCWQVPEDDPAGTQAKEAQANLRLARLH